VAAGRAHLYDRDRPAQRSDRQGRQPVIGPVIGPASGATIAAASAPAARAAARAAARSVRAAMIALCALLAGALLAPVAVAADVPATQLITAPQLRTLLDAQRGKVVVVNVWGTWCVPCLREIPDLVALEQELAPRGVLLVGLGMDEPGMLASQVEPFRLKYFPGFRTWLRNEPDMDALVSTLDPAWNEILPTTYLIGRDGKVARKIQGRKTPDEFRALLAPLL
jgi:thiol-disulfide isomerase/thioredoxin